MNASGATRYWAFISYSHADRSVARWLHRALETYRIPKQLIGTSPAGITVPKGLFPIFRDEEDLSSSHSLSDNILDAMRRSEVLIVIASPSAVRSRWVNDEIRAFKAMGRSHRVICAIADGEPLASNHGNPESECFPPALRFEVDAEGNLTDKPAEPMAADLRRGQGGKRDALLKLVAGVLGLELNALRRRDLQRRQRFLTTVSVAAVLAATFTTGLSIVAIKARDEAREQRQLADERRDQAEGMIQFMLGDLRMKLEPLGKLDLLDAVGDQAMRYFRSVNVTALSDAELAARAKALRQIGDVRVKQGRLEGAAPAFEEAVKLDEELGNRHPNDEATIFNFSQSAFYVGYAAFLKHDFKSARTWLGQYEDAANRLIALDSENPKWQLEGIYARQNLAQLNRKELRFQDAVEQYAEAAEAYLQLLKDEPDNRDYLAGLAEARYSIAVCQDQQGALKAALESVSAAVQHAEHNIELAPNDITASLPLAKYLLMKGVLAARLGNFTEASPSIDEAVNRAKHLLDRDSSNAQFRRAYTAAMDGKSRVSLLEGRLSAATQANKVAIASVEELMAKTAEQEYAYSLASSIAMTEAELGLRTGNMTDAAQAVARARTLSQKGLRTSPDHRRFEGRLALYEAELHSSSTHSCPRTAMGSPSIAADQGIDFGLALLSGDRQRAEILWPNARNWMRADPALAGFIQRWCQHNCTIDGWSPCG